MAYKIFDDKYLNSFLNKKSTPCYIYDSQLLIDTLDKAKTECATYFKDKACIHYALKANDNPKILKLIKNKGFGVDCVSGGEIKKALSAGFEAQDIVFAGVGKQDFEIEIALNAEIYAFNCESLQEVEVINAIASKMGKIAGLMFRVNPDIDAQTHKHISTGKYGNKFGIMFNDVYNFLPSLDRFKHVKLIGLHYHIGSQITNMKVFAELGDVVQQHYALLFKAGYNLEHINVGGGLGIDYVHPEQNMLANFTGYFATLKRHLQLSETVMVHFELGRSLVAQCGILLSQVLFIKNTCGTNFAIIDAGMNDLMRPALYEAKHKIVTLTKSRQQVLYNIVGPVCESTDIFAQELLLPELKRGDIVVIQSSGAYGHVLANQYNSRDLIKEYVV